MPKSILKTRSEVVNKNREVEESAEKAVTALDGLSREYAVQAGLDDIESKEAKEKILNVALNNGVTADRAFASSQQMVSSGFSSEMAESDGLDIFLKAMASGNMSKQDPKEVIQASGQFMAAFGMEKNAENLGEVLVRMRGLFQGTDTQVGDLSQFAKAAPAMARAGVNMEDSFSAFTMLREQMAPGEASTQLRNVVQNIQGAGASEGKVKILDSMGLKPEDVDFHGETLEEVLDIFREKLQGLSFNEQDIALEKLVEKSNVGAFSTLLGGKEKMQAFNIMQGDRAGFVKGVNTAQSGVQAAHNRIEVQEQIDNIEHEEKLKEQAVQKNLIEKQRSKEMLNGDFGQDFGNWISHRLDDVAILTGARSRENVLEGNGNAQDLMKSDFNEKQLEQVIGPAVPANNKIAEQQLDVAKQQLEETKKSNQKLDMQNQKLDQQNQFAEQQIEESRRNRPQPQNPINNIPAGR